MNMNAVMDRILIWFFWIVGWVSGGGMLTALITWLMDLLHVMPANEAFVTGCLWGTCGTVMGNFMVHCFKIPKTNPIKE